MIPIRDLFETHLNVADLDRSIAFYRDVLELPLATVIAERRVAFFWIGAPGKAMLGLWETGSSPQRMSLHLAFEVGVEGVLQAIDALRGAGLEPRDLGCQPTTEPVVLCWMPAVAVYFYDPDGNLLEFIAMLPQPPRPDLGVTSWSQWLATCPLPDPS